MAIHTSILAWKILWTEEPGGLQSMAFPKESDTTALLSTQGMVHRSETVALENQIKELEMTSIVFWGDAVGEVVNGRDLTNLQLLQALEPELMYGRSKERPGGGGKVCVEKSYKITFTELFVRSMFDHIKLYPLNIIYNRRTQAQWNSLYHPLMKWEILGIFEFPVQGYLSTWECCIGDFITPSLSNSEFKISR